MTPVPPGCPGECRRFPPEHPRPPGDAARTVEEPDRSSNGAGFFRALVDRLDNLPGFSEQFRRLGPAHHRVGMSGSIIRTAEGVFVSSMEETIGDRWSPEYSRAWWLLFRAGLAIVGGREIAMLDGAPRTD